jgi:hypothetical protein
MEVLGIYQGIHSGIGSTYGDGWIEEIIENIFWPGYGSENEDYRDLLWSVMKEDERVRLDPSDLLCLGNTDLQVDFQQWIYFLNDDPDWYKMMIFEIEAFVSPKMVKLREGAEKYAKSYLTDGWDVTEDLAVFQWNGQWFLIMPDKTSAIAITVGFLDNDLVLDEDHSPTSYYGLQLYIAWDSNYIWSINTTDWMTDKLSGESPMCFPLHYETPFQEYNADLSFGNLSYIEQDIRGELTWEGVVTGNLDFWTKPEFEEQLEKMRFNPKRDPKLIAVLEDLVQKGILERVP